MCLLFPLYISFPLLCLCQFQLHLYFLCLSVTFYPGHEEHSARVASISLGMMLLVIIPCLLLLVCGANYWIRQRIAREEAEAAAALLPKPKWKRPQLRQQNANASEEEEEN